MCTLQTEAPTILMQSSCRVFGHRFRCIVMFNEMLDICTFWWRWLRNAAGTPSNPSANSQNGTHHGLALTTMRHTRCHPTCRETKDVSRNRHIAPRCRACCDLQRNQTVVLRNSSRLHTEKHDGKPHRGTKTMSAQVGESHASTVKRLSKSPTRQLPSHNARRSTPRNNRIRREAACGPTRPQHTSQKNMFSRAANFNYHDMLRTSLSSDTQTPLVSNTADYACPMPTAPPLERGNAATRRVQPTSSHPTANRKWNLNSCSRNLR